MAPKQLTLQETLENPPEEEQELDMWGCGVMSTGGYHSDSYGDDGDGACIWCGAAPERTTD